MFLEKGYTLQVYDIFSTHWTDSMLLEFLGDKPVCEWFNYTAPRIKNGEINPHVLSRDEAIAEMIADNFLIKRPLIEANGEFCSGFDNPLVEKLLKGTDISGVLSCPHQASKNSC